MASQVLSGSSNFSYTNNTGQNVRVVINFMRTNQPTTATTAGGITMSWGGVSVSAESALAIGRNLAFTFGYDNSGTGRAYGNSTNMVPAQTTQGAADSSSIIIMRRAQALPTEIMLSPGQTFSATCGAYNVVVIPEAG